jgi:hypothetical protein
MQQAELKLTEINLAYKHLLAYFDPNLRKSIKVACPQPDQKASFHESVNPSANSHKEPAGGFAGEKNADPKSSAQFDNIKIQSASKKQGRRNRCEKLTEQSINLLGNSLSFLRRQETGEFVCGRTVLCI